MLTDTLLNIAETFGTPTYVYDLDQVSAQYRRFKKAFHWPDLRICYAMKANYNRDILTTLKHQGAGIDAVSPGDLFMALSCGFSCQDIIYTANNITDQEMETVTDLGVLMNVDSLSRLEKFGKTFPGTKVCLRFNPDVVDGEYDKIRTGGDLTKFGILLEDASKAAAIARQYRLRVAGLHEHTGSGLQKTDSILKAMEKVMAAACHFPDLEFLDFGGGFKIPYRPAESAIDIEAMGQDVVQRFSEFCRSYGRNLELRFEPGKFLSAEAGVLLVRVNTVKQNRHRTICGTDSGFPQLIRPMFYGAYHHIDNLSNPQGIPETCDICGNICETGDLFAKDREIPQIREGDVLAIRDAGAYGYAMGGTYNLRPMPAEVVIQKGTARLSRKRLTPKELVDAILQEYPHHKGKGGLKDASETG